MLERISINISTREREVLETIAVSEMWGLRDQIRFLLHEELEKRGLLASNPQINPINDVADEENQHVGN